MLRVHNLDLLAEVTLLKFYEAATESKERLIKEDILSQFDPLPPIIFFNNALDLLHDNGLIVRASSRGAIFYVISAQGIRTVQEQLENSTSNTSKYRTSGDTWLFSDFSDADQKSEDKVTVESPVDHSLQDTWEPLPLDRNNELYEDAATSAEAALHEIEQNNGYAASVPEERNHIVRSLKEGIAQLREGLPSRQQLVALLISPLKFVARKFPDAAMGVAAKAAVEKIFNWLATFL